MHAIIANGIARKLCIQDKTSFILGGVAPDASSFNRRKRNFTFLRWHNEKLYEKDSFQFFFSKI